MGAMGLVASPGDDDLDVFLVVGEFRGVADALLQALLDNLLPFLPSPIRTGRGLRLVPHVVFLRGFANLENRNLVNDDGGAFDEVLLLLARPDRLQLEANLVR